MKKFAKALSLLLVLAMVFSLAACGGGGGDSADSSSEGSSEFAGGKTFTIKIGHSDTTANLIHISLEHFAEAVKERTNGQLGFIKQIGSLHKRNNATDHIIMLKYRMLADKVLKKTGVDITEPENGEVAVERISAFNESLIRKSG